MALEPRTWKVFGSEDEFWFSPSAGLFQHGQPVEIRAQQSELLQLLIEHAGHLVEHDAIKQRLWPDTHVVKNNEYELMSTVRDLFGADGARFIRNERGRGYRWVAEVHDVDALLPHPVGQNVALTGQEPQPPVLSDTPLPPASSVPPYRYVWAMAPMLGLHLFFAIAAEAAFVYGHLDTFSRIAVLSGIGLTLALSAGLWCDWTLAHNGRAVGVVLSVAILVAGLAGVCTLAWHELPPRPLVEISSLGWPSRAGFLKSAVIYPAILAIPFILLPFHSVATINAELRAGRGRFVYELLSHSPDAVAPAGSLFVRPLLLGVALAGLAVPGIPMTLHLLNSLRPVPESALFSELALLRFISWWSAAVIAVAWYAFALNDLKQRARPAALAA